MGLFDRFGNGKKAKAEEEEAKRLEQEAAEKLEAQKNAHAALSWPLPLPVNPIRLQGAEDEVLAMPDSVSPERKDEIGPMIYEEKLGSDALRFLQTQEVLFLLTTLEYYNRTAPIENFDAKHQALKSEVLNRVRDAEKLYVLVDTTTGYPYLDFGNVCLYLDKNMADAVVAIYAKQMRKLTVREARGENIEAGSEQKGFLDYLYFVGMERMVLDAGYYRMRFARTEIVAPHNITGEKGQPPTNPGIAYAITDFLEEARWPVKYDKRLEVLQGKEAVMLTQIMKGTFMVPLTHEGPVEVKENGQLVFGKDTKISFPILKNAEGKTVQPVFTDGIELSKAFPKGKFEAGIFAFNDVLRMIQDKDGMVINPKGQNLVLPKERLNSFVAQMAKAAQQAKEKAEAAKNPATAPAQSAPEETPEETKSE